MANYIITTQRFGPNDSDTVLSELETYLETIDDTTQTVLKIHFMGRGSDTECLLVHEDSA